MGVGVSTKVWWSIFISRVVSRHIFSVDGPLIRVRVHGTKYSPYGRVGESQWYRDL